MSATRARGAGRTGPATGVYLWAGDATADLLRFKFPDRPVNREAHRAAHRPDAARRLDEAGFEWAFLSMNWGFPPERERQHWEDFRRAVRVYRARGFRLAGYVQASNCAAVGSYAGRDWYARTPDGGTTPYFRRRLMTCWNHPGWVREVERRILRAARAGADAAYLDNLWMGATPWTVGGRPGGFAGCACGRCRSKFRRETGTELPARLRPGEERTEAYLSWRVEVVRRRVEEWRRRLRDRHSGVQLVANNCDAVLRDTRNLFGLDPGALAPAQDAVLLENVAMPEADGEDRLVANALPVKAMRAWTDRPVWTVTYEAGIGVDGPPEPRRVARALAESAAAGGRPMAKGGEYLDRRGRFTVITEESLRPALEGAGRVARWLSGPGRRLRVGEPEPGVAVYLDRDGMSRRWAATAPATVALGLALIDAGVPFEFVADPDRDDRNADPRRLRPRRVLVPPGVPPPSGQDGRVVRVNREVLEVPAAPSSWTESGLRRRLAGSVVGLLAGGYFRSAFFRRALEETGLVRRFLRSPLFRRPEVDRDALRALLPRLPPPLVRSRRPVLAERRRGPGGDLRLHLVNYVDATVTVTLSRLPRGRPRLHTPDPDTALRPGAGDDSIGVELELYAILVWGDDGR